MYQPTPTLPPLPPSLLAKKCLYFSPKRDISVPVGVQDPEQLLDGGLHARVHSRLRYGQILKEQVCHMSLEAIIRFLICAVSV